MTHRLRKLLYDRAGVFKLSIFASPLFVFGLVAKLYAGTFFGGTNFTTLFVPFLKYFSFSETGSPYQFFFNNGLVEVFPYPQLMLYIMSIPGALFGSLLHPDLFIVTHKELLLFHLPILAADIVILVILSRWLKNKHRELLWFYWLSPILFYINYIHSQLDAIPIAITFAFLYLLFKERWGFALSLLGAAIAAKFHIIILLPFTLIYLWKRRLSLWYITLYTATAAFVFLIINNVQLLKEPFLTLVFNNREQSKVFQF